MKTILEALTELRGLMYDKAGKTAEEGMDNGGFYLLAINSWDEFVAKWTQEYANDLTPDAKVASRVENDLDSITAGSDSTQKVKIYYNSRTDSAEDIRKRIDVATEAVKVLKEKMIADMPGKAGATGK